MTNPERRDYGLPEERQKLFDIAVQGIDLIKGYQNHPDKDVSGTAMHFLKYFEDIKRVAASIMNPLNEEQKQQLRQIQTDAMEKITRYVSDPSHDQEVKNTAMHFTRFFEQLGEIIT